MKIQDGMLKSNTNIIIHHGDITLTCNFKSSNLIDFSFTNEEILLWECILEGLWVIDCKIKMPQFRKSKKMNEGYFHEGDYFQQTISKNVKLAHFSFTALFHTIIKSNRNDFSFIKNIYSSVKGEYMSNDAVVFWDKQVQKEMAEYLPQLGRYRAFLD